MKGFTYATVAATALIAATLALASPAVAAPTDVGSAQDTVNQLEADGFKVIVTKVGTAPLSQCTVAAVRPGREITHRVSESGVQAGSIQEVLYTTVYVDANC